VALVHQTLTEQLPEQIGWRPDAFYLRSQTSRFRVWFLR
jgi:hypothetical protein